jgi:hypothetical protein
MNEPVAAEDAEVEAIAAVSRVLSKLADPDARGRVISYVLARFAGAIRPAAATAPPSPRAPSTAGVAEVQGTGTKELDGIARLGEDGSLRLTVRDLKANSTNDAAVRLAHVAIYAHEYLTGGQPLSSKGILTPLLKEWRVYDGNTRARLAREKGIIRNGDMLNLDAHARRDAERYVKEILEASVEGSWKPK